MRAKGQMPQYLPFGALQENSHAGVGKQSKAGLLIVKREVGQNRGGFVGNLERSARQQGFEVLRKDADRFLSGPAEQIAAVLSAAKLTRPAPSPRRCAE